MSFNLTGSQLLPFNRPNKHLLNAPWQLSTLPTQAGTSEGCPWGLSCLECSWGVLELWLAAIGTSIWSLIEFSLIQILKQKCQVWRWLSSWESSLFFQRAQVWFPALTQWLTTVCYFSTSESNAVSWPLQTLHTCAAQTCKQAKQQNTK